MSGINEMLKNPEMLKMATDMAKNNPEILEKIIKGNHFNKNQVNSSNITHDNLSSTNYQYNEKIMTKNLKNEEFNNNVGLIKNYQTDKNRFEVLLKDKNKTISIKPENLIKIDENYNKYDNDNNDNNEN